MSEHDRRESWVHRLLRRKPVIERRLRVCNLGSIFGGEETEWSTDPNDPDAVAFREKHADLRCLDHCPWSHYDWELHRKHLIVEERVRGALTFEPQAQERPQHRSPMDARL